MALAQGNHTVLVFVHNQFRGDWTRWSGVQTLAYTANRDKSQLLVVVEDNAAAKTTYFFSLRKGDEVWIERNVIHIPAICVKSVAGDAIRCR